jgi:hypothetical protein
MQILLPFVVPIVNFILQAYPRFFNKLFGVDVWTRLLETDHIRKNNHKIPREKLTGQFIVDGYFDYPPFFPTVLSYVPKDKLLQIQGFICPFIDSLQVVLVYFVAMNLTNNMYIALLAQAIYMLTPMIALENSYLTPRALGYLNFSMATIPLLMFIVNGNIWYYIAGVFFTTFLFLTQFNHFCLLRCSLHST